MQASSAPTKFTIPFANAGARNTIPQASQIGVTPGAASLTDGFPPLTRTPIAAGGVPPFGQDMNGILYMLSANIQFENAGGIMPYDSAFSTAIGGYPKGAILANTAGTGYWFCTTDNNTANPDTGGAGWLALNPQGSSTQTFSVAAATAAAHAVAQSQVFGVGQTMTDVKASRAVSTVYTNSTGKPIAVYIQGLAGGTSGAMGLIIGGVECQINQYSSSGTVLAAFGVVPAGATYQLVASGGGAVISLWSELR